MKHLLLQLLRFLMRSIPKQGLILPLVFLVCNNQASAVCTANAAFKYKDSGGVVYFTNQSTGANRYIWYFGDGTQTYGYSPTHIYKKDTTMNYCVTLMAIDSSQTNCFDTAMKCFVVVGCGASASFSHTVSGYTASFNNTSWNGKKYYWSFGDGTYSSLKSPPTHTYSGNGGYSVKLVVTDTITNCKDSVYASVKINVCSIAGNFTYKDSVGVHYFTNTSSGGNSYSWKFGDNTGSSSFSPSHAYAKGKARYVYVSLKVWNTTNPGCYDSVNQLVYIQGCDADARFTHTASGYTATFTSNIQTSSNKYKWYFGDGSTSTAKNPSHTYSSLGNYSVRLVVTDSINKWCRDSIAKTINLNGCSANASYTVKDSSGVHYFTNTSTGANSYYWSFGDGSYSSAASPTHTYAKGPSRYVNVYLFIKNTSISGCEDSLFTQMFIQGCNANASFTYTISGYNASFTSPSQPGSNTFKWYFGDGSTSTAKNPSHTYSSLGSYNVKLVVNDTWGCKDSLTRTLNVNGCAAKASFTVKDSAGVHYFTNTSTGANSYSWYFGDGGSSSVTNPSHTYAKGQTYTAKLVARNTGITGCRDSLLKSIIVPACGVKSSFTNVKQGLKVTFTNYSNGHKYLWRFGNGVTSTTKNPVYTYSAAGTYLVSLIAKDTVKNCTDSISYYITVTACYVDANFTSRDSNNLSYFTNTSIGGNKYLWNFGDGSTSTAFSPSHRYSGSARNVLVWLLIKDTTLSNCTDTGYKVIYYPGCKSYFTKEADTNNIYSALIVDRSRCGANATYLWEFGDGDTSHSKTPTHIYGGLGPYALCLTVTDGSCSNTFCDTFSFDSSGNIIGMMIPFSIRVIIPGQTYTSIEEAEDYSKQLKVFPNPGSATVHIESGVWTLKQVTVVDIQGKEVMTQAGSDLKLELNVEQLSQGLYFINVQYANDKTCRIKYIKN